MKFSYGRAKWSLVLEKQSGVQLWQSTALFGEGKAKQSLAMAKQGRDLQRQCGEQYCDGSGQ